jgi:translation initiation factor IF-3
LRVIASDGSQLGIKTLGDALTLAREVELDLVLIAPQATPPVAKIMDYGKWRYEEAQKAKESRRKSIQISIKEMKYRPKIGMGDFDTKTRMVERFLTEGHKVKITIMFRGREMAHPEIGMKILEQVAIKVADHSKVEAAPKLDGRNMVMVLAPEKKKPVKPVRPVTDGSDGSAVQDDAADAVPSDVASSDAASVDPASTPTVSTETASPEATPVAEVAEPVAVTDLVASDTTAAAAD